MRRASWASLLTVLASAGLVQADVPGPKTAPASSPAPPAQLKVDAPPAPAASAPAAPALPLDSAYSADVDGRWQHGDGKGWGDDGPADGGRIYGGAEYLLWWLKGYQTPPLVTTGTAASEGILGNGGVVLFGNERLGGEDPDSGVRVWLGTWLDDCHHWGVEGGFFILPRRSEDFFASSTAFPTLARPFTLSNGTPTVEIIALPSSPFAPGVYATGAVAVQSTSQFWGANFDVRANLCRDCRNHLDLLAGFRYLDLEESLSINEFFVAGPAIATSFPSLAGTNFNVSDRFATRNQFYGGQIGLGGEYFLSDRISLEGAGTVALGVTHETVEISGATLRINPGGSTTSLPGGLLALSSNSGRYQRNPFAVVPEATMNIGYYITPNIRASVGYNFLYWSRVVRPGDQIDTTIDRSLIPSFQGLGFASQGGNRPAPLLKESDFWAQGINIGLEFRW